MERDGNARAEATGAFCSLKLCFPSFHSSSGRTRAQVCEWNRWLQTLFAMHITVHLGLIVGKLVLLPDGCQFKSPNRSGKSGLGK